MSNVKHPCLPHTARMLSAPSYLFGICLLEALHTRDQVSHVSVEHPGPGSSARTFFGRSRARHKTGSISASHMSELKSNDTQRILMNFHVVCSGLRTDKAIPGLVFDVQDP